MTYQRNGQLKSGFVPNLNNQPQPTQITPKMEEEKIKINGYAQVIEMLKTADAEFRESLLKRITRSDPKLGLALRKSLKEQETDI